MNGQERVRVRARVPWYVFVVYYIICPTSPDSMSAPVGTDLDATTARSAASVATPNPKKR